MFISLGAHATMRIGVSCLYACVLDAKFHAIFFLLGSIVGTSCCLCMLSYGFLCLLMSFFFVTNFSIFS